jgi:hypothetical protein
MSASNVFLNWSSVTVAYASTTITLTGVTDVHVDGRSVQLAFYGDARQFPRILRNVQKTRKVTIVGADVNKLLSIPEDTAVTITAVLDDALNGHASSSGALSIVASNAKRETSPFSGKNNQFAEGSVTLNCDGGAGDTDPIAITVL